MLQFILGSGFVIILAVLVIVLFLNFVPLGLWISARYGGMLFQKSLRRFGYGFW